jgi:hypothetical protein
MRRTQPPCGPRSTCSGPQRASTPELARALDTLDARALYNTWSFIGSAADSSEVAVRAARAFSAARPSDQRDRNRQSWVLAQTLAYRGHVGEAAPDLFARRPWVGVQANVTVTEVMAAQAPAGRQRRTMARGAGEEQPDLGRPGVGSPGGLSRGDTAAPTTTGAGGAQSMPIPPPRELFEGVLALHGSCGSGLPRPQPVGILQHLFSCSPRWPDTLCRFATFRD